MTQLNDKDHKAQMEDMKSFDEQMPCTGKALECEQFESVGLGRHINELVKIFDQLG